MSDTADVDFANAELANAVAMYGTTVSITRRVSGAYDATQGKATVVPTVYTTKGILLSYKDYNVDGTMVMQGDRKLILSTTATWSPSAILPVPGDQVSVSGAIWNVINVNQIALQGAKVSYVLQMRGQKSG